MKRAIIEIEASVFLSLLRLEGYEIHSAGWKPEGNTLTLQVSGPGIGEAIEAADLPSLLPLYTTRTCGHTCELGEHARVDLDRVSRGTVLPRSVQELPKDSNVVPA